LREVFNKQTSTQRVRIPLSRKGITLTSCSEITPYIG